MAGQATFTAPCRICRVGLEALAGAIFDQESAGLGGRSPAVCARPNLEDA